MAKSPSNNNTLFTLELLGGGGLLVLGFLALNYQLFTGLLATSLFGWILLLGGIVGIVVSFGTRNWGGFFLYLMTGILSFVAGAVIIANPTESLATITGIISIILIAGGIFRFVTALLMRFPHWGWSFAYGLISLALGVAIWRHWPTSSIYFIGLFIGLEFIVSGLSTLFTAISNRHVTSTRMAY